MDHKLPPGRAALAAALLIVALPNGAAAQDRMPTFDPRPGCRNAAALDPVGGRSPSDCLADEEQARSELAGRWREFPAASRTECSQETRLGGTPSYVELLTCLQMAGDGSADTGGVPGIMAPSGARPRR